MKKLLLCGTALVGLVLASSPAAAADGIKLGLGGFFRGYAAFTDSDEAAGVSRHEFEFRRDSEIHFSGETTADNGLTVGVHTEMKTLGNAAGNSMDEAYMYTSGGWGRVNFGSEDGAAYLLQVAAPSADSNVDGLRVNIASLTATIPQTDIPGLHNDGLLDYDHADFKNTERMTYLTPKFSGFQAGLSYAPKMGQDIIGGNTAGMTLDSDNGDYEDIWDASVRWDGDFQGVGISLGGGYSSSDLEANAAAPGANQAVANDGLTTWNAGLGLTWGSFSLGGSYSRADTSNTAENAGVATYQTVDVDQDTWVVGLGWDNGPYHVGASYLNQDMERDATVGGGTLDAMNYESDRWAVGGGYTFGPGMSFRGAVEFGEFDPGNEAESGAAIAAGNDNDFTQFTLGTDIQF